VKTPYLGRATIGGRPADVDIPNVDLVRWEGIVTSRTRTPAAADEVVVLLDQPRPGWSSRATVSADADGVVRLEGTGQFFAPRSAPDQGRRSQWVRKSPTT